MKFLPCHLFALLSMAQVAQGVITIGSPSSEWTPIAGDYDFFADQQTGDGAADIVGSGINYGFLMSFDDNGDTSSTDGNLAFRIRFNDAGDKQNPPNFKNVVWVGIDADLNGSIDVFLGLDAPSNGGAPTLSIRDSGDLANTSPSTTSISSASYWSATGDSTNYSYRAVDYTSGDGGDTNDVGGDGNPDYYVSFLVPFQQVVNFLGTQSISITDQSPLRYIVATSQQTNSLNQDLGGIDGGIGSTTTWEDLGGLSDPALVPEPSSGLIAFSSLAGFLLIFRRR